MKITKNWTLFLDRDGVINERIPNGYVRNIEQFQFINGSKEAIAVLNRLFGLIVVVTNQQGIGKELMTKQDLLEIHNYMLKEVELAGGQIHQVYHCPDLVKNKPNCRKPNPTMALQAKADFPNIDFSKSVMVGDSISDMEFGIGLGMKTVFVTSKGVTKYVHLPPVDYICSSLHAFSNTCFLGMGSK